MKVKKMKTYTIINLDSDEKYYLSDNNFIRDYIQFVQRELLQVENFDASQVVDTLQTMFDDFRKLLNKNDDDVQYYDLLVNDDTKKDHKNDETQTLTRHEIDALKYDALYEVEMYKLYFQVAHSKQCNDKMNEVSCSFLDYSSMTLLHDDKNVFIVKYNEDSRMPTFVNVVDKKNIEIIETFEF